MYYAVKAKCGHSGFGRGYFVPIEFAVPAVSARDAALIVRGFPRVKHHHKNAIIDVRAIDKTEYNRILQKNLNDPYLKSHSIQEQRRAISPEDMIARIQEEPVRQMRSRKDRDIEHTCFREGKTIVENPHRYRHYWPGDRRLSRVILPASA